MDIKVILNQIKEQLGKLTKKTKIMLAVLLAVLVMASVVLAMVMNNTSYATLFIDLNATEASEIMGKLQEMDVAYKYQSGTILVDEAQEPLVKAQLVSQGYPKSGLTYDVFTTNIDMMTTDFERKSYLVFDLQDRIAATIRCFDGVSDAIVTLALGEEQKYVLQEDKTENSASVVVIMAGGGTPGGDLVDGVVRLVANSVPGGMSAENVTVLDGSGRAVSSSGGSGSQYGMAQLKLSLENEIDTTIRSELLHILGPIYGEDKVRISVKSTVDVDKKIREIIEYVPSQDNRGVINRENLSSEYVRETGGEEGGVPGAETNAEVPVYEGVTVDGDEIYFNDQSSIDYLVGQIKEQVQSDSGVLTDLMVSVAIDGAKPGTAKEAEIRTLIARTAGIADEKKDASIALYYDNFAVTEAPAPPQGIQGITLPAFFWPLVVAIGIGIVLIAIMVAVIRSKKDRREEMLAINENLPGPPEDYIMDIKLADIKKTREQELKEQITDFAEENPEISAQLIKTWLKGVDME